MSLVALTIYKKKISSVKENNEDILQLFFDKIFTLATILELIYSTDDI